VEERTTKRTHTNQTKPNRRRENRGSDSKRWLMSDFRSKNFNYVMHVLDGQWLWLYLCLWLGVCALVCGC